jgi:hypothetical protein
MLFCIFCLLDIQYKVAKFGFFDANSRKFSLFISPRFDVFFSIEFLVEKIYV